MEMTMKTRQELVKATTKRYQKADRQKKSAILDEFCANTQYNRDYAATLLRIGGTPRQPKSRRSNRLLKNSPGSELNTPVSDSGVRNSKSREVIDTLIDRPLDFAGFEALRFGV
jgi:hypothetical protein